MAQNKKFDVIIIGTGAGGGTLAYRQAQVSKKMLILEHGGFLSYRCQSEECKINLKHY